MVQKNRYHLSLSGLNLSESTNANIGKNLQTGKGGQALGNGSISKRLD